MKIRGVYALLPIKIYTMGYLECFFSPSSLRKLLGLNTVHKVVVRDQTKSKAP